jgi:hypothetical protein
MENYRNLLKIITQKINYIMSKWVLPIRIGSIFGCMVAGGLYAHWFWLTGTMFAVVGSVGILLTEIELGR